MAASRALKVAPRIRIYQSRPGREVLAGRPQPELAAGAEPGRDHGDRQGRRRHPGTYAKLTGEMIRDLKKCASSRVRYRRRQRRHREATKKKIVVTKVPTTAATKCRTTRGAACCRRRKIPMISKQVHGRHVEDDERRADQAAPRQHARVVGSADRRSCAKASGWEKVSHTILRPEGSLLAAGVESVDLDKMPDVGYVPSTATVRRRRTCSSGRVQEMKKTAYVVNTARGPISTRPRWRRRWMPVRLRGPRSM